MLLCDVMEGLLLSAGGRLVAAVMSTVGGHDVIARRSGATTKQSPGARRLLRAEERRPRNDMYVVV